MIKDPIKIRDPDGRNEFKMQYGCSYKTTIPSMYGGYWWAAEWQKRIDDVSGFRISVPPEINRREND
ncbi:MAG: hypothetical protein ACTSYF_05090 [Promethearchaeota archaeon]